MAAGPFLTVGGLHGMSSEVEYRRYAAALLGLAKRTNTAADKFRLLVMAEAWLTLANKMGLRKRPSGFTSTSAETNSHTGHQRGG